MFVVRTQVFLNFARNEEAMVEAEEEAYHERERLRQAKRDNNAPSHNSVTSTEMNAAAFAIKTSDAATTDPIDVVTEQRGPDKPPARS